MLVVLLPLFCTQEQLEEVGSGENGEMLVYELASLMTVPLQSVVRITGDL